MKARITYSLVSAPTTFSLLTSNVDAQAVYTSLTPAGTYGGGVSPTWRVVVTPAPPLSFVESIRFDFPAQQNGFVGYGELDALGAPTVVTPPLGMLVASPTNGQTFLTSASVTATGTVMFGTAPYSVTFSTNGVLAGAGVSNAPSEYQLSLGTLAAGTYSISAAVTDGAGSNAVSATNLFTVLPLGVTVTSPTNNQVLSSHADVVAGAAMINGIPPYTVKFYTNGAGGYAQAGADATSVPYQSSLGTLAAGTYRIYAAATDSASPSQAGSSATNSFTVTNLPPSVAITAPANNSGSGPLDPIVIEAAVADDSAVTNVTFYADGFLLISFTNAPYRFTWKGAAQGAHALKAVAWDDECLTTTSSVATVTVARVFFEWHTGSGGWGDIATSNLLQSSLASAVYQQCQPAWDAAPDAPGAWTPGAFLVNGIFENKPYGNAAYAPYAVVGNDMSDLLGGASAQFDLDLTSHPGGYDITSVRLFAEHVDGGWVWPGGDVTYQLVGDATWHTLAGKNEFPNPWGGTGPGRVYPDKAYYNTSGMPSTYLQTRTSVYPGSALTRVSAIRIDFRQMLNGGATLNEIGVFGRASIVPPTGAILIVR